MASQAHCWTEVDMTNPGPDGPSLFRLYFRSLFDSGRGYAFPCDGNGVVDLDQLSESARNNYLYARAMIGRELAAPAVERAEPPH
jgi:hypothetical protein